MDTVRTPWIIELEEAIRSLRDIEGVSVQADGDELREVHILTVSRRPAKQIVRDVQTLLLTRFKRSMDHRIVSVAYADGAERAMAPPATPLAVPPPAPSRPVTPPLAAAPPAASFSPSQGEAMPAEADRVRFESANLFVSGARVQAQVELRWRGAPRTGSATGWSTRDGAHRLIAAATLAAVQEFLDDDLALSLDALEFTRIGRRRVVVVGIELLAHRETKDLVGVCTVGRDAQQAVVLATLSAVNRVIGGLRVKGPAGVELRPTST